METVFHVVDAAGYPWCGDFHGFAETRLFGEDFGLDYGSEEEAEEVAERVGGTVERHERGQRNAA